MSLPFETDLTEYARQCTLQRRHYEACQKAQPDTTQVTAPTDSVAQTTVEALSEPEFREGTEQPTQGCLSDLLETSVEPLTWGGNQSLLNDASNGRMEARQWCGDRSPLIQPHVASSTHKKTNPVSYGAP